MLGFQFLNLRGTRLLRAAQMCFCPIKRKPRSKPANFFIAHCDGCFAVKWAYRYRRRDSASAVPAIHFAASAGERVLVSAMPMRPGRWRRCRCWRWGRLHLQRTDVGAIIDYPHKTRAALIRLRRWIARVDRRAIRGRQMG